MVGVVVMRCHYSEAYRNFDAKFRILDWKEEEQKENKQANKLKGGTLDSNGLVYLRGITEGFAKVSISHEQTKAPPHLNPAVATRGDQNVCLIALCYVSASDQSTKT